MDWIAGDPLEALAGLLAPARVRAAYPGVWLRPDVWATHGHYLDVHMTVPSIERLGAGVMRRIVTAPGSAPAAAEDYEAILSPIYAWLHAVAQGALPGRGSGLQGGSVRGWRALTGPAGRRGLRGRAIAAAWPLLVAALNRAGLGPLRAEISGPALRRSGLRGMDEVCARLGVTADYVIFGHTHRAGPLPDDEAAEWVTSARQPAHQQRLLGPRGRLHGRRGVAEPLPDGLRRRRRGRRPAPPAQSLRSRSARPGVKQTAWQVTPWPTASPARPPCSPGGR